MKNILIFSLLALFLLGSCYLQPSIKGDGNVTKEQRAVTSFDKVEIASGPFTVYLTQGDTESVEVEFDDNLQQYVEVRNDGSTLVLDVKGKVNIGKTTKNNVYISLRNIDLLSLSGVCKVKTTGSLQCAYLSINVSGVSDGELDVSCDKLDAGVSGVSNLELRGNAKELNIKQSGVGKFNAQKLIAEKVDVVNSGVGSVSVYASQELSMSNSGVGSITYSGDADIKTIQTSGVGKINKVD